MHRHGTMTEPLRAIERRLDALLASDDTVQGIPKLLPLPPPIQQTVAQDTMRQALRAAENALPVWEFEIETIDPHQWEPTITIFAEEFSFKLQNDIRAGGFWLNRTRCWTLQDAACDMWEAVRKSINPTALNTSLCDGVKQGGFGETSVTVGNKVSEFQWTVCIAHPECGTHMFDLQYLPDTNQFQVYDFKAETFHAAVNRMWEKAIETCMEQYGDDERSTRASTVTDALQWEIHINVLDNSQHTFDLYYVPGKNSFQVITSKTENCASLRSAAIYMHKVVSQRIQAANEALARAFEIEGRRGIY
jgi:hypothetical protein